VKALSHQTHIINLRLSYCDAKIDSYCYSVNGTMSGGISVEYSYMVYLKHAKVTAWLLVTKVVT
jgi:hypothetical protein